MDPNYTREYERIEEDHWWHLVRRRIIHKMLDRFITKPAETRWLDAGCGTGVLLKSYPRIPNKLGLELDGKSVERARAKGLDVRQTEPRWDFREYGQFDLVSLCDVIEHVEQEADAITAVKNVLRPGGTLLITVPALMSLWSSHDLVNHHYRRYSRKSLLALFPENEWEILKLSYFCSFLLPLIYLLRKLKNRREKLNPTLATHDAKLGSNLLDKVRYLIFLAEMPLVRLTGLPLGSSLLLVARRRG